MKNWLWGIEMKPGLVIWRQEDKVLLLVHSTTSLTGEKTRTAKASVILMFSITNQVTLSLLL